jgi:small nuclear ribonucleoprotein (snRNP)-like protein
MEISASKEELAKEVKGMFGKILRARVSDSRIIEGEFQCLDKDMNVVLSHAREYHAVEECKFITLMYM